MFNLWKWCLVCQNVCCCSSHPFFVWHTTVTGCSVSSLLLRLIFLNKMTAVITDPHKTRQQKSAVWLQNGGNGGRDNLQAAQLLMPTQLFDSHPWLGLNNEVEKWTGRAASYGLLAELSFWTVVTKETGCLPHFTDTWSYVLSEMGSQNWPWGLSASTHVSCLS